MNILFLGPSCPRIENFLRTLGHVVHRQEDRISPEFLEERCFNFCISYRYRYILTPRMLQLFQNRPINMHISILPWNRGSDPNLWSFLKNTPKGVTIHHIDESLDGGDIILQQTIRFDETKETLRTTYAQLSDAVESLFTEHAECILAGALPYHPQASGGSYHRSKDKIPFLPLIKEKGWDTPVAVLAGAGLGWAPHSPEFPHGASLSELKSAEKLSGV